MVIERNRNDGERVLLVEERGIMTTTKQSIDMNSKFVTHVSYALKITTDSFGGSDAYIEMGPIGSWRPNDYYDHIKVKAQVHQPHQIAHNIKQLTQ